MLTYQVTQQAEQGQTIFNGMLIEWDARDAPEWLFSQMCPSWPIKLLLISRASIYLLYPCLLSCFPCENKRMIAGYVWTPCISCKSIKTFQLWTPTVLLKINCGVALVSSHKTGIWTQELWEIVRGKERLFLFRALHTFISGMISHYSVMAACRNLIVVLLPLGMISSVG